MEDIIIKNIKKYPLTQPDDIIKLVFQSEYGGGHLIKNEQDSLSCLINEINELNEYIDGDIFEEIGSGKERLHINVDNSADIPAKLINKMHVASSAETRPDHDLFIKKIELIDKIADLGVFSFSLSDFKSAYNKYSQGDFKNIRHSQIYRNEYHPHYRVVNSDYKSLLEVILEINKRLEENTVPVIIGMDGRSGAGKTHYAQQLKNIFNCEIIHMDDFFLPFELRRAERYEEPGGNIHYERFIEEAISPMMKKEGFAYRVFDCQSGTYLLEKRQISSNDIYLIEGAYSLHPRFNDIYDIKVFVDVDRDVQLQRIEKRNGLDSLQAFKDMWIPLEEKYISFYNIEKNSDFIVSNS